MYARYRLKKDISTEDMEWKELHSNGVAPTVRNSHRMVALDTTIVLFGGRGNSSTLKDTYVFDVEGGEWFRPLTKGCSAPARENYAIDIVGSRMYVFGGQNDGILAQDMYVLDTDIWKWEALTCTGDIPTAREKHSMAMGGTSSLYLFGGHDAKQSYLNDTYKYNCGTGEWTLLSPSDPPIPRQHHSMASIGDKVYMFGGKSSSSSYNDLHVLDSNTDEWTQLDTSKTISPACRWGHTLSSFGQYLVLFGGWNGTWCFNDLYVFDTVDTKWHRILLSPTSFKPSARAYHSMAVCGSQLVVSGGRNGMRRMMDSNLMELSALQESLKETSAVMKLSDFELRTTLGTGSFGRVRLATYMPTGQTCAVKILKKADIIRLKQVEHIIAERKILGSIDHPFVVNLLGHFQNKRYLYLVMEFVVGGEFFTHLRRATRFNNDSSCFYAAQIVIIFQYLHSKDIVYRDLKPENLLLDHAGNIKLTDFGFAKRVEYRTWTLCGTPEYIAPEVLMNKGHGKPVDWWALGILIFEMLSGSPPFVDADPMAIYQQILAGRIHFPRYFDRQAKDLIRKLLSPDITKRLGNLKNGVEDIKRHKWFEVLGCCIARHTNSRV